jgi:hypothetical protein
MDSLARKCENMKTGLSNNLSDAAAIGLLIIFSSVLSFLVFPHVPTYSLYEGSPLMHLSEVRMILESFPAMPVWNSNWYFGNPFLRFYTPLCFYLMAFTGWALKISIFQIYPTFTAFVFCAIALVTFCFCRILRFGRLESVVSSLFLVTSFNFYSYWDAGSMPNILGTLFSFVTLVFISKAIETGKAHYTVGSGISIAAVALSHPQNLLIIAVLSPIFTFAVSYFREGLFGSTVSKRSSTLMFVEAWLIGGFLASWWYIPYVFEGGPWRVTGYFTFSYQTPQSFLSYFTGKFNEVLGTRLIPSNYISPGIFSLGITFIGLILMSNRHPPARVNLSIAFFVFMLLILVGFFSLLQIPLGLADRYSTYFSFFTCILAGYTLKVIQEKISRIYRKAGYLVLVSVLIIATSYNSFVLINTFSQRPFDLAVPQFLTELEKNVKPGERIMTDDLALMWEIGAYTNLQQWGGSDYGAMTNDFAYWFWNKIYYEKDYRYIPYFARNFNVKLYLNYANVGMEEVMPGVWEPNNFNSSLVELVDSNTTRVLFVGQHNDYMDLFLSISQFDPEQFLLVYGGPSLDYDLETLEQFQIVYLATLSGGAIQNTSNVLSEYLEMGGGVILDLGLVPELEGLSSLPELFPIYSIYYSEETLNLSQNKSFVVTEDINFSNIAKDKVQVASFDVKEGCESIVLLDGKTVMASSNIGAGRLLISGLALSRIAVKDGRLEEAKLLLNTIKYAAHNSNTVLHLNNPSFNLESSSITINVTDCKNDDGIWFKMSYYAGWKAFVGAQELRIFEAGPGSMLVFPNIEGQGTVSFTFTKAWYVLLGEALSLIGFFYVTIRVFLEFMSINRLKKIVKK